MRRTLACLGSISLVAGKVYFSETFDDAWEARWTQSKWRASGRKAGTFELATGEYFNDESEDRGLHTVEDARLFDVSASFNSFSNEGKELIVQYQLKYEKDVQCGGGYIKLGPKMADGGATFGEETPYNIMFGPDQCGNNKRTHLIFSHKGKNIPKSADIAYQQDTFGWGASHLYRMILKPDNTVRVEVDEIKIYEGSIKEDWEVLESKEIPDPEDRKPDNWIEEFYMDDPSDKKPDDWVEEKRVVDDSAKRPHDWDDQEDGEWQPPVKINPAYKGEWVPFRIPNPEYKGDWAAKLISNPAYDDHDVYKYADFSFVGIDVWQLKGSAIFDNIIITDDLTEADWFAAKWKALHRAEMAQINGDEATPSHTQKEANEEDEEDEEGEEDEEEDEDGEEDDEEEDEDGGSEDDNDKEDDDTDGKGEDDEDAEEDEDGRQDDDENEEEDEEEDEDDGSEEDSANEDDDTDGNAEDDEEAEEDDEEETGEGSQDDNENEEEGEEEDEEDGEDDNDEENGGDEHGEDEEAEDDESDDEVKQKRSEEL